MTVQVNARDLPASCNPAAAAWGHAPSDLLPERLRELVNVASSAVAHAPALVVQQRDHVGHQLLAQPRLDGAALRKLCRMLHEHSSGRLVRCTRTAGNWRACKLVREPGCWCMARVLECC